MAGHGSENLASSQVNDFLQFFHVDMYVLSFWGNKELHFVEYLKPLIDLLYGIL